MCLAAAIALAAQLAWRNWGTGAYTATANAELRQQFQAGLAQGGLPPPLPPVVVSAARPVRATASAPVRRPRGFAPRPSSRDRPTLELADVRGESLVPTPARKVPWRAGDAVALLRIPRIKVDVVVVEGVDERDLRTGPGHYSSTAYPWEARGRVGFAGHRTTYGAPFWSLDRLRRGDFIDVTTRYGLYRYRVTDSREVSPARSDVLNQTPRPTLVLTTCTPRFSAARRLIVFADRL